LILPLAVFVNRFLAPECDFNFGISINPLYLKDLRCHVQAKVSIHFLNLAVKIEPPLKTVKMPLKIN
jgi:hypothetical protein